MLGLAVAVGAGGVDRAGAAVDRLGVDSLQLAQDFQVEVELGLVVHVDTPLPRVSRGIASKRYRALRLDCALQPKVKSLMHDLPFVD